MIDKNEFDPARARNGEPVQLSRGSLDGSIPQSWEDVHYIGPDVVRGGHIIQHHDGSTLSTSALRMKPKRKTFYVNLYSHGRANWHETESLSIERASQSLELPIALAVPVEVEL